MRILVAAALALGAGCDPSVNGAYLTFVDSANAEIAAQDAPESPLGQQSVMMVYVRNVGGGTTSGTMTFSLSGAAAGDFVLASGAGMCAGSSLAPAMTCVQQLAYTAGHEGKLTAELLVETGDASARVELDTDVFKPAAR